MGRSKFPGKPSKSINRKRISVLQLDPNNTTATTTTATHASATAATTAVGTNANATGAAAAAASSSTTNSVAAAAAAAAATNNEDDEEQKKAEENSNLDSVELEKRKNGKKEEDDDEDGGGGPPSATMLGGGGNGTARSINGGTGYTSTNNQRQQQRQQQQNNGHNAQQHQQQLKTEKTVKNSLSSKEINYNNIRKTTTTSTFTTNAIVTTVKEIKKSSNHSNPITSVATSSSNSSCLTGATVVGQVINISKRPCKKFKNLNIHKPEVMLPSSSKLKLQQQQQQQQQEIKNNNSSTTATTSPAQQFAKTTLTSTTTTTTTTITTSATAVSTPLAVSTTTTSSPSPSTTTAAIIEKQNDSSSKALKNDLNDAISSSSSLSFSNSSNTSNSSSNNNSNNNNNEYHKTIMIDNNNTTIDHEMNDNNQPNNNNNNSDDAEHRHLNVNNNNNNNNDDDDDDDDDDNNNNNDGVENSSLTFSTTINSHHDTMTKNCYKTNTVLTLSNGTRELTNEADTQSLPANDDGSSIIKQPALTPLNSPTRTMESNVNGGSVTSSPSTSSTTSCSSLSTSSTSNASIAAVVDASSTTTLNTNSNSSSASSTTSNSSDKKQKKTVTFKNVLETSDDKSAVKKFYNPDNRKPLVSIIKKECLNRPFLYTRNSDCIVRPSRLTEILKNNSNIDKLNSLKFRSATTEGCSVLSGPLSRVFGAPSEEEDNKQKQNIINFRLTKEQSDEEDDDEEDEEEDEVDDDEAVDEEENEETIDNKGNQQLNGSAKLEIVAGTEDKHKLKVHSEGEEEDNDDDQQMIVDKHFVLPKRSSRSSRVIKPNKRLIEDGIICKKSSLKTFTNHNTTNNSVLSSSKDDKIAISATATATAPATSSALQPGNYFGLADFNAKECNGTAVLKSSKDLSLEPSKLTSTFSTSCVSSTKVFSSFGCSSNTATSSSITSSSGLKPSSFVLRQPRLQFESLTTVTTATSEQRNNASSAAAAAAALALTASLPKSLQQAISSSTVSTASLSSSLLSPTFSLNGTSSMKTNNTTVPTPAIAANQCAVCSSIIQTKNLPQATKYVEPSCEHCRKFISKIAKKSLAVKNSPTMKSVQLQCKADGNCMILPLNNKAGHVKNFKKVYKERCGFCWLKKCLQTLQLPKVRLNAVLPVLSNATNSCKSSLQDTKSMRDLNDDNSKLLVGGGSCNSGGSNGGAIKWKPSMDYLMNTTNHPTATPNDTLKLSLKTNPLVENNVTFGSVPLLRPAILEKPLFLKSSSLETKQEKGERKLLDVLKDLKTEKTEPIAVETITSQPQTLSKSKKKDKSVEKERKEVRIKEMHSPKMETDKTKESKEKLEISSTEFKEAKNDDTLPLTTTTLATSTSTALCSPTTCSTSSATTAVVSSSMTVTTANDKRQRIDLKGPRVKHVCRSASIVLGQPIAMFGEEGEEVAMNEYQLPDASQQMEESKLPLTETDENDNCASCKTQQQQQQQQQQLQAIDESVSIEPPLKTAKIETKIENTTKVLQPVSKLSQRPHHYNTQLTAYKKQINSHINPSLVAARTRKEPQMKCKLLISIDFWENYDPAEVCQTGFGLIVTETVAQRALCFLCGSAGQEPLIFCSCCCEPYHQYCVQDEFNLKHGSLDDTLLLNESCLSVTGLSSNTNTVIAKLNWLCPRCTVCYTCNMSSGAKVKCQKCQKNYHSTCLGTSKRLLGADRPLICVNCLKCRSCSTTKVTKFVGNLPMCTNCFKLRKKGNYCPVCQKCYDDQDFDLKMMECGDCRQWVHAKCETLTDEQYNLLSTLPESIEFICKRCSRKSQDAKQRACEWREAVKEEFKSNLLSVLKLLSKSRQACALLKLSPRKQMKCSCTSSTTNNKFQPKSLHFNSQQLHNSLNCDQDSLTPSPNIDIYEFDDRERDQVILNHTSLVDMQTKKCLCQAQTNASENHLSLVEIKHKISNGSYVSLAEFNYDMNSVIQQANCDDLVIVYKEILSEQFPWFQNETQACTDALEEDMYESSGGAYGLNTSIESESDYNMDCLPSSQDQQDDRDRSVLLAELPQGLEDQLYNIKSRQDSRICLFCRRTGEGLPTEESRLLYCGHDCWVHTNCALWSAEVFEEIDGSLQNVHSAVARGRMIKCSVCGNRGATVGCNVKSCGEHYHYPCARSKNCAFLADKSMYCPQHATTIAQSNDKVCFETQFEVTRPVYVELERKRKKLVEPSKVQFHIGSLEVKQLGHILPRFSDTYEALVPVNFLCSRLYWSSKEPWKIVEYTVRTYIYNATSSTLSNGAIDLGKNFTVDHSQNNSALIQFGLSQIQQWHLSLSKGDFETAEEYDYLNNFSQHSSSCSANNNSEANATNDEEPQTNADLLPPEIKDAIFEDLPGDLLEGISMLDIFTKCMNYEDMAQGEQSKDGVTNQQLSDEDTITSIGAFTKQLTAELNSNWSSTANQNHVEDALFGTNTVTAAQAVKLQKLKKSSSPVISCDVNTKNAIKRRKLSENMLISLNNHQRSQKKEVSSVTRRLDMETANKRTFTWSAEKRYNLDSTQTESKIKLMQVDGVDDSITEFRFVTQEASQTAVKCERCQCTYRNIDSFQRHLNNCEPMSSSTSESESEHTSQTPDVTHSTTQALTLEQLQELNNKLQHQQQQQQRTTQLPFIQSIPAQTLSQLQGLQTANILQGVQLQGVQNLQNLQNLHNIQQLTQPQTLGGNFFISTTQPEINPTASDLQLYANTLQGLTANLNGTFTLQPTSTQYTTANQLQQNQPQLIAVSTNPDGTQQIIQLPSTATHQQTAIPATYQTLQATNSDKKIVLPVTQGKPLKTMATKAAQQAAAKNKLKATTVVKPIQSKMNVAGATTTPNHITHQPQTVNATQLLNQQLLQQLQQAQQNSNQPQLLFQTTAPAQQQQPQIIMQQPQNIISFVTTTNDSTQQPQLQYVTLPTAQPATEYKPQTQTSLFTTANTQPLLQSAYLQTDASGNLVLTNAPPQTTTPLQLLTAPQTPQVIGTLIQPQTLQLQGGNVITTTTTATAEGGIPQQGTGQAQQQQVIISGNPAAGTNGLEMLTAAATTPQVILATTTQPMYYGLETIVQNTVMSSQQFVSTAMPGVLSQNASFSATTTQVFQASKIEPLVDIPAGYVLLNNVDANNALQIQTQQATNAANTAQQQANQNSFIQAALQQQAQAMAEQQQQQQQQAQNNVYRIQTPPVTAAQSFQIQTAQAQPQIIVTQQPQASQQQNSAVQTQFVEATNQPAQQQTNVHLISAKITPVAQVKRSKSTTPVAAVTKVQPQVVNKVMPNVIQVNTTQTQVQPQKLKLQTTTLQQSTPQTNVGQNNKLQTKTTNLNNLQQQQQSQLQTTINATAALTDAVKTQVITTSPTTAAVAAVTAATVTPTATITTTAPVISNKKTNMIRPLNKMEVKPKVMKTATATVVTKPANNLNASNTPPLVQTTITSTASGNKMIVLKPQQQPASQTTQQQTSQQPILTNSATTANLITEESPAAAAIIPLNNITEPTENTEFMNLQHVANTHQQHYNVADALLLDDSSQVSQQTLSHCSFSTNTTNNFEVSTHQQPNHVTPTDNISNILPTIQRMPQYTNINIVNPLQQYSTANTSTNSSTSSSTTITRPTNRVLPMQQRQYEQHQTQTSGSGTTSSSISNINSAAMATQFSSHVTTTTTNSHISQNHISASLESQESSNHKTNIDKIAYEAEVKQMLLHSPQAQHELQQGSMQQQQVLHMQQQQTMHNLVKISPPPLSYDLAEKAQDTGNNKHCLHDMNYVHNGAVTEYVNSTTPEECLITTDPKFPPEGEVILGNECCEANEEEVLNDATHSEENEEQQVQDDEEDDGFSLKMPSADGSDNLSMDSDEPAVKEKISKILDNLTNEDCNDSLNTTTTLEAQVEMACNNQYLNTALQTTDNCSGAVVSQPQEANEYYTPTTEETSAFIAAQLAAENMKDHQTADNYNIMESEVGTVKLQEQVENSLNTNYMSNCQADNNNLSDMDQQPNAANLSNPITISANQAPQPPSRDPKRIAGPHLLYEIQSEDGFTYKSSSITEIWEKVFEAVQVARRANGLAPLPEGPLADMSGVQMIGLKTNALKYLIEQLPGVEKCNKYTPKYHRKNGLSSPHTNSTSSLSCSSSMSGNASVAASLDTDSNSMDYASDQEDLNENLYECARFEPYAKRSEYDMFSWLASRHRKQPVQVFVQPSDNELVPRRGTGSNLPMAMKYRTLKETYKDYVGVFRSHIHGRGLYCTKDIEAGEMVIEYAGELIRSTLTDHRERYYNSRGIGCYMFKIDDHLVVDATMRGNAARFINHSCEPNCYSKVVDILGHKHIIIFALRRIVQGEELTYDYKFPFEDEKIPCSCGSKKCRKYLN